MVYYEIGTDMNGCVAGIRAVEYLLTGIPASASRAGPAADAQVGTAKNQYLPSTYQSARFRSRYDKIGRN